MRELAAGPGVVLLCGRYEGVDQRVIEARGFLEVSLGDFVLSGGELAAMALIDACVRLLPGVVGDAASLAEESFAAGLLGIPPLHPAAGVGGARGAGRAACPGHHARISAWRHEQALAITKSRRPDLVGTSRQ